MPSAVRLREDYSAAELRALARRSKNVNQSRRLLSLAADLAEATDAINDRQTDRLRQAIEKRANRRSGADPRPSYKPNTEVIDESRGVGLALVLLERFLNQIHLRLSSHDVTYIALESVVVEPTKKATPPQEGILTTPARTNTDLQLVRRDT
jgi:hypothetical protein